MTKLCYTLQTAASYLYFITYLEEREQGSSLVQICFCVDYNRICGL